MKLFGWNNNKLKIFNLTIFKIKLKNDKICFYLFFIKVLKIKSKISKLINNFKINKNFDVRNFDEEIKHFVKYKQNNKNITLNENNIVFLATTIYDIGGHTKCIRDLAKSLTSEYKQFLFLTNYDNKFYKSYNELKNIFNKITTDNFSIFNYKKKLTQFINKIIEIKPKILLVYIHPNDFFGDMILYYIKNYTNINILYFNHASHYPCLGMTFADIILEASKTTENITKTKRYLNNTKIVGLQSVSKNDTIYFSEKEKNIEKTKINIKEGDLVSMSGGASYKFFDKDNNSQYFEMIYDLLNEEQNLKHVIITELSQEQESIVNKIFKKNKKLKERLIFVPYRKDFDILFQCTDVFIDSFPVSSALTQIDLMRNKVASVVKINKENPEFSFEDYQMKDYPYMFENIEDMKKCVIELLHNKEKRNEIINKNYDFWLNTYERDVVKNRYIEIFEELK